MSGWERTHRRYELVYAVADDVARHGPVALDEWQRAIDAEYGSTDAFLLDVRRRWDLAVVARMEEDRPLDDIEAEVSRTNAGLRAVLRRFADHPALAGRDQTAAASTA
ncbi:hypothetical protein [Haloechinothrix salitolerans]|uniref:Uncharacterized protein n=1 Tax=Haloechinothrix salitolerans TaxID=926830 RepID=A0ABW2BX68_9PSEU